MQVHCNEGVAIRIGPEPCVGIREDDGEASAGERIGQPSSRVNLIVPSADVFESTEGKTDGRVIASVRPARRGRRPWHVWKLFAREPGGLGFDLRADSAGPHREDEESKPMMYEPEKSDSVVVATKPTNKAERSAAEPVEPRTGTEGNAGQQSTCRAQYRESVSQALERVRRPAW